MLLDVSRLIWRAWSKRLPTGIDRTCLAYVRHYRESAQAVIQRGGQTCVLSAKQSQKLFDLLLEPSKAIRRELVRLYATGLFAQRAANCEGRVYLNVGHTGLDKPYHANWILRFKVRPIYFVHDLIPLTHPEYCRPGESEKHLRRMNALVSLGVGVVGNSRETLNALAAFSVRHASSKTPLGLVAPLGVEHRSTVNEKRRAVPFLTRPYFVMLGTIEGRKNHLLILNLWADFARRLGPACPQLIVIGQRGWECEQVVDILERCEAIRGHVIELSRCDDETLGAYLRNAQALLFPSFAEGYGLPLVEALACGTPVIASDLTVFRELARNIPDYLSPIDGLGWMHAIEEYARKNSAARAAQIVRMSDWTPPTWEEHFARVDAFLEKLSRKPE